MVEACRPSIDAGRITLVTVDSIDNQSWCNWNLPPGDRGRRHNDYDRYVIGEVDPLHPRPGLDGGDRARPGAAWAATMPPTSSFATRTSSTR